MNYHWIINSTFVNVLYRPPNGKIEQFKTFLIRLFSSVQNANKDLHIAGDFDLNLLDHESNKKVDDFWHVIYRNGMIPTINKSTRVTRTRTTAIDHICTNSFIDRNFKTAFFKSDISDHFPICLIIPLTKPRIENKISPVFKGFSALKQKMPLNKICTKLIRKILRHLLTNKARPIKHF